MISHRTHKAHRGHRVLKPNNSVFDVGFVSNLACLPVVTIAMFIHQIHHVHRLDFVNKGAYARRSYG